MEIEPRNQTSKVTFPRNCVEWVNFGPVARVFALVFPTLSLTLCRILSLWGSMGKYILALTQAQFAVWLTTGKTSVFGQKATQSVRDSAAKNRDAKYPFFAVVGIGQILD